MRNMKKFVALALATTMVLGNSLTAFAEETNTGNSTGAGTSEGHVDKKATNVVIPTSVAENTFAYTMDPERLIGETSHAKYGNDVVFPASNDTGVYFNNGLGTGENASKTIWANTSKALDVVNKSSHSINLTVKAEAVAGNNDIPLVAKSAISTAENASLYLGLVVGSEDPAAIAVDTAATATVPIAGTVGNFKTAVKTVDNVKTYEYRALTADEWKTADDSRSALTGDELTAAYEDTWAKTSFNLEGAVTSGKAITSNTTAPSVRVTWSWVDPSANAAPSIATTSYNMVADTATVVSYSLGLGDLVADGITSVVWVEGAPTLNLYTNADFVTADTDANTFTLTTQSINNMIAQDGDSQTIRVTFADGTVIDLTFNDPA